MKTNRQIIESSGFATYPHETEEELGIELERMIGKGLISRKTVQEIRDSPED
jgi:hypothetical protein